MFLAGIFLAALARSFATPTPGSIPNSSIPNPICVASAALMSCKCEPTEFRSIYDIIWSCLGTILLCTYISIHHNIPDRSHSWTRATLMKVNTTLCALLAPELVIMWAMRQRIMAGRIAAANKHQGWTKAHAFFLQMGGLMVEIEKGQRYEVVAWGTQLSALIRGTRDDGSDQIIEKIPKISDGEINDRSKSDFLAKMVVILHTAWFVVHCIARYWQGLELTELELVTLAFAMLNFITYILWWDKPLNVCHPIYFDLGGNRVDGPSDDMVYERSTEPVVWLKFIEELTGGIHGVRDVILRLLWFVFVGLFYYSYKILKAALSPLTAMTFEEESESMTSIGPFYAAWMDKKDHMLASVYSCAIAVVFGGIHLLGWNYTFTTKAELWLWRSSSLVLTVVPLFMAIVRLQFYAHAHDSKTGVSTFGAIMRILALLIVLLTTICTPLYVAARIILIFLAFFSLRNLSDSAYQNVPWTDIIPHL